MEPAVKKWRKFRCARRGGDACCYNRQHSEPGVVPGDFKWEIPDCARTCRVCRPRAPKNYIVRNQMKSSTPTIVFLATVLFGCYAVSQETGVLKSAAQQSFEKMLRSTPSDYAAAREKLIAEGNATLAFLKSKSKLNDNWYEKAIAESLILAIEFPEVYSKYEKYFSETVDTLVWDTARRGARGRGGGIRGWYTAEPPEFLTKSPLVAAKEKTVPFLVEKLFTELPHSIPDETVMGSHMSRPSDAAQCILKIIGGKRAARAVAITLIAGHRSSRDVCESGSIPDNKIVDKMVVLLSDRRAQPKASWVLGELQDPRAIEPLIASLTDNNINQYYSSAEALAKFGESAIPALIDALSNPRWETRSWADHALAAIGSAAVPALSRYLDEGPSIGHYHAVRAIRFIADPQGVTALIKALRSKDLSMVGEAARGLGEIGDSAAKEPLLKALENPKNWHPSGSALFGITGALARFEETRAFDKLAKLSRDDDWIVRRAAIGALPAVDREKALPVLLELIRHEHKATRVDAASALGKLRDPNAVPALIHALSDAELSVRSWAAWSLGEIGDAKALSSLRRVRDGGNKAMNRTVSEAIKKIQADVGRH